MGAFAKAGQSDAQLFKAWARAAEQRMGDFSPQNFATAWAFAIVGQSDAQLFTALARAAEQRLDDFNSQDLANTAWAFAAANSFSDRLFGTAFAHRCETAIQTAAELNQLHQWVLWHWELKISLPLSPALCNLCFATFKATPKSSSQLQSKVAAALTKLCARVKQEAFTAQGYSIDIIVLFQGQQVAIEVDGPTHFLRGKGVRTATGATMLKHRQLRAFGCQLAVVPYWDWQELQDRNAQSLDYLSRMLKQAASSGQLVKGQGGQQQVQGQRREGKRGRKDIQLAKMSRIVQLPSTTGSDRLLLPAERKELAPTWPPLRPS